MFLFVSYIVWPEITLYVCCCKIYEIVKKTCLFPLLSTFCEITFSVKVKKYLTIIVKCVNYDLYVYVLF